MVKKRNGYECLGSHCYPFRLLFWTWPCASFNSLLIILNVQDGVISLLSPESHYVFPLVPNFGTPCEVNKQQTSSRAIIACKWPIETSHCIKRQLPARCSLHAFMTQVIWFWAPPMMLSDPSTHTAWAEVTICAWKQTIVHAQGALNINCSTMQLRIKSTHCRNNLSSNNKHLV